MKRMTRRSSLLGAGAALLLLQAPLASAQADASTVANTGVYLGGSAIYTRIDNAFVSQDFPNDDDEFDDDRVSWKAFAGLQLAPGLAVEAQYLDFGSSEGSIAEAEAEGWTAALVAGIPLGGITPFAKAGALFWDTEARAQGPLNSTLHYGDDGTDFFWGLGLDFHFTPQLALRVEYERYSLEGDDVETDIDAATAGLRFSF